MYKIQNVVLKLNLINLNFLLLDHVIVFLHIVLFYSEFHVLVLIDLILLSIYSYQRQLYNPNQIVYSPLVLVHLIIDLQHDILIHREFHYH
jgi:hypothetical protein